MFIHLGNDVAIKKSDIIGIFDIENTSVSKETRDFLSAAAKRSEVIYVSLEMPKSFVVAQKNGKNVIYISLLSASTLKKRMGEKFQEFSL